MALEVTTPYYIFEGREIEPTPDAWLLKSIHNTVLYIDLTILKSDFFNSSKGLFPTYSFLSDYPFNSYTRGREENSSADFVVSS